MALFFWQWTHPRQFTVLRSDMTQFASDAFTGADDSNLVSHTSDSGHSWAISGVAAAESGTPAKIWSNATRHNSASGNHNVYYLSASPASAEYTVTVSAAYNGVTTDLTGPALGVAATSVAGSSHAYIWQLAPQSSGFRLRRYDGATPTTLVTVTGTLTSGVVYVMTIGRASGGVITGKVQRLSDNYWLNSSGTWAATAATAATATDTTYTTADKAGISVYANSPFSSIDDFSADETSSGATATTLSGPSSGTVSVASTNFTVGANGTITGTVTVTPADGGAGGTFTPTTVAISSGTPTGTFTYTPASTGVKTISISDNGGLTDATSISYTSNAAASTYAPHLTPRSSMGTHFYGA